MMTSGDHLLLTLMYFLLFNDSIGFFRPNLRYFSFLIFNIYCLFNFGAGLSFSLGYFLRLFRRGRYYFYLLDVWGIHLLVVRSLLCASVRSLW